MSNLVDQDPGCHGAPLPLQHFGPLLPIQPHAVPSEQTMLLLVMKRCLGRHCRGLPLGSRGEGNMINGNNPAEPDYPEIVTMSVYFHLCTVFYYFLSPFLGKDLYQYIANGVYSFLALSVLILYARCATIDPADQGILIAVNGALIYKSEANIDTREENGYQQEGYGEEALFCTRCNTEVRKNSKHCLSCDKCVDGFDHHSWCLNNCVGRKNYATFLCLVAVSLVWLAVECGVGIAVFVRYFTAKTAIEDEIRETLGYGIISQVTFAVMVTLGTTLSVLASLSLGGLFFFHMLLIRKGMTTYEYKVARRAQSEPPGLYQ